MNKRILGLDLSLTATGWALVWDGSPKWGVIKSKHRSVKRLSEIRNEVRVIIYQEQPSLAVIEGYSYGSHQGMAGLAELGGVVRLLLLDMGVPFIVVQPTTNKKFATGKGNAEKDLMLKRVFQHWGAIVHHKGLIARYRMEYPTKRHARWAQHLICTTKNASRLRCFNELKSLIEKGRSHEDDA